MIGLKNNNAILPKPKKNRNMQKQPEVQPQDMTAEELKSLQQKTVEEKLKLIGELNKIAIPLNVTVFSHGGPWTIRNKAFWKQMSQNDEEIVKFMHKFLTEQKA